MIRASLLAMAASIAVAAEARRADLGLWIETLPTASDYRIEGDNGTRSGSDALDSAYALRTGIRYTISSPGRAFAPQLGIDAALEQATYAGTVAFRTYAIAPAAGLAWAPTDRVVLSSEAFALLGATSASGSETAAVTALDASGTSTGYGLRVDGYYQMTRRWYAGGVLTWRTATASLHGSPVDVTWTGSGVGIGIGIIWRTDVRPAGLE